MSVPSCLCCFNTPVTPDAKDCGVFWTNRPTCSCTCRFQTLVTKLAAIILPVLMKEAAFRWLMAVPRTSVLYVVKARCQLCCRHVTLVMQGLPAQDYNNMQQDALGSADHQMLEQKMQALQGLHPSHEGGAWLECCIKTYFTDKSRPLETCQFRMFDTALQ